MSTSEKYTEKLVALQSEGRYRSLTESVQNGKWITVHGRRMINLSSNDYLGLASDASLREEFFSLPDTLEYALSSASSRLLTGNHSPYVQLEDTLASLYGRPAALVFSSGYHLNTGILPALCDRQTLILADKLVHASLIDGIRLSGARCIRYRHQDYRQLETLLQKERGSYRQAIIVTESIFSMDGDTAPLDTLVEIKHRHPGTMLYLDEAHAVGVRGRGGLGLAEEYGLMGEIDLLCGTFGKALASVGAFVVCSRTVREWLVNTMRTLIFTTALPPLNVAWTHFIVQKLASFEDRRELLRRYSSRFGERSSHIVPVPCGADQAAVSAAERLQEEGFYVLPIRPPTVPEGTARLRISLTAALDKEDVDRLICKLSEHDTGISL